MKKLLLILLLLLLSPLLLPLYALVIVFALGALFYRWLWLMGFCWTHADRVYLICSRRRDWEAFLRNNLIPSLPHRVAAVWIETPQHLAKVIRATRIGRAFLPNPFLVLVTPFGIKSTSLNQQLQHLKRYGKMSADVRTDTRSVIDIALSGFSKRYHRERS